MNPKRAPLTRSSRSAAVVTGWVSRSRTRWREGTGLGLSIAISLVELHGGEIEIRSQKDVGTEVVVLLLDATQGLEHQDLKIADKVLQEGRALIIAINKWDGLDGEQRRRVRDDLDRRIPGVASALLLREESAHRYRSWHEGIPGRVHQ